MLKTVQLLLPALIPSWNFFDVIAPSPRVEVALLEREDDPPRDWQTFRPKPDHVSLLAMARRMVWNPRWNESLFVVSCSERLVSAPTQHSVDEIAARIRHDLARDGQEGWFAFRLVFVHREGDQLTQEELYVSPPFPVLAEADT